MDPEEVTGGLLRFVGDAYRISVCLLEVKVEVLGE